MLFLVILERGPAVQNGAVVEQQRFPGIEIKTELEFRIVRHRLECMQGLFVTGAERGAEFLRGHVGVATDQHHGRDTVLFRKHRDANRRVGRLARGLFTEAV